MNSVLFIPGNYAPAPRKQHAQPVDFYLHQEVLVLTHIAADKTDVHNDNLDSTRYVFDK